MMHRKAVLAVLAAACLTLPSGATDAPPTFLAPADCIENVDLTPDLCQTDEAFRALPYRGSYSCGPTAFANVLIAMDRRGYENLVLGDVRSKDDQRALLLKLGARPYLETSKYGIGPIAAMRGIRRFVSERGYQAKLEWQGWRHGGEFAAGRFVDPGWLREGVGGDSSVVLNVGWYDYDPAADLYSRVGGHYMTLVGFRPEGDRFTYLIHDPASRSGPDKVTHEARLASIPTGRLAPWKQYGQREARGHFLIEGIVLKRAVDAAILDGAIRLTISNGD
ncbi:MAG: hypothetical protein HQ582_14045 [Planctomycetes bacterium]|nr:hypothetical protein [Planctomycetota bacterium]